MRTPHTRFYTVRKQPHGPWARIWITDDGCFTTISDHGNFGYWWGAAGDNFRRFLCECDDDYVIGKLAHGATEYDGDRTRQAIRELLQRLHDEGEDTRDELCLLADAELDNEVGFARWVDHCGYTGDRNDRLIAHADVSEVYGLASYRAPVRVQMFMKHVWPLFIAALRAELDAEAAPAQTSAP